MTSENTPRMRLTFRGTPRELRAFLAEVCLLSADPAYEWELTASMARHPAGKDLGFSELCPRCHGIGRHLVGCVQPDLANAGAGPASWRGCRSCGSTGPVHASTCDTLA